MATEDILDALGILNASDSTKAHIMRNIMTTVDSRFAELVDELLSSEQVVYLNKLVDDSASSPDTILTWLEGNVTEAAELYSSILQDYIIELKEKLA